MAAAKKTAGKTAAKPRKAAAQATPEPQWAQEPDPVPTQPAYAPPPTGFAGSASERQYTMFLHLSAIASSFVVGGLSFVGPLIMWAIKKQESPFVDRHGRQAVNFHLSVLLYAVALVVLIVVLFVTIIGIVIAIPLIIVGSIAGAVAFIVLPILAGLKANEGREYQYPFTIQFLKDPTPPAFVPQ